MHREERNMSRKKNKKLNCTGNWHEGQRNQRVWSQQACRAMNASHYENFMVPVKPENLNLVSEAMRLKLFREHDTVKASELMRTLAWDVYDLKVLPYPFGNQIMDSEVTRAAMGRDLADCLNYFKGLSVIYSGGDVPFPDYLIPDLLILDVQDVALTQRKVGMPVLEYLLWLKGNNDTRRSVIAEWSGIPVSKQEYVYRSLLDAFREYLKHEHAAAEKYSKPVQFLTSGININCHETKVYNF